MKFIVIEGNIGTGKTSLTRLLADEWDAQLILEEFSDNPFLPLFYKNPERYAFPVELFFMTERHKQLHSILVEHPTEKPYTVSDYIFSKTALFAGQNLTGNELELFQRLFHTFNSSFRQPDLLVYLHRPVEELLKNIRARNRAYELDIKADYLEKIQEAYFQFFEKAAIDLPILLMEVEGIDFVHRKEDYARILTHLQPDYPKGLHRISF